MSCYRALRSANNTNNFNCVNNNGNSNNNNANNTNGVPLGSSSGRQSNLYGEIRLDWREGVHDLPIRVNIRPDVSGRTLLAWYGLQVISYFMPGDTMYLV